MTWACRLFTTAVLLGNGWVFVHALDPKSDLSIGQTWPLFVAALPAWGAMFLVIFRRAWKDLIRAGVTKPEAGQIFWEAIPWTTRILVPAGAVVLILIATQLDQPKIPEGGGGPDRRDGRPVLVSHGRELREITEEEYRKATRAEVCHFASIAIIFAWIATAVVWTIPTGPPRPPYGRW